MKNKHKYGSSETARIRTDSDAESRFCVYGVLPVMELMRAGSRNIEKVLVSEGVRVKKFGEIYALAREHRIRFEKIPKRDFLRHVDDDVNHQGVIAITSAAGYYDEEKLLSEIFETKSSLSLILDGIEDPRNLGAIIRTAEGAGVEGMFIPERRAAGLTETVAKSSAGATEYVKIAKVKSVNKLIDRLKENDVWVVGTSGDAEMDYFDWDWRQSSALVLGSEGSGLHRLTAEKCDLLVKIPMYGKIESLNVSVAAGVVMFEAKRQKGKV